MPESMSVERRKLMAAYGATFDLTPREKGMKGAIERANELVASTPNAWMPNQFANEANIRAHALTTAREILADFPTVSAPAMQAVIAFAAAAAIDDLPVPAIPITA